MAISKAVVLAPHPDDGEFGCGGTIKKLSEEGVELWYVAFSPCIKSLPEGLEPDHLLKELEKAAAHLGIPASNIISFQFEVREFPRDRQLILEELIKIRKQINPDLVLLPNSDDVHQDHHVIHQEGIRAFKHCCLLGYELPWNNLKFTSNFHVRLEESHLDAKMAAVNEYKSQSFRLYKDESFLKSLARTRGVQVNKTYAEAFELIRWIH